jgi:hypothetical protein
MDGLNALKFGDSDLRAVVQNPLNNLPVAAPWKKIFKLPVIGLSDF